MRNGLPATRLDSFVYEAGESAEQIYGDEGVGGDPPPYDNFTKEHRINAGITGQRDAGLTTGHGSYLPDAWGADEFIGAEWDQSGANGDQAGAGGGGYGVGLNPGSYGNFSVNGSGLDLSFLGMAAPTDGSNTETASNEAQNGQTSSNGAVTPGLPGLPPLPSLPSLPSPSSAAADQPASGF